MISRPAPESAFLTGAAGALPSRSVAVLEAIKHAILAGELPPGRALVETDLAVVLGVSKTPVREALKTLAGAGLVTMHPYKGAVVRLVDDVQARYIYDLRLLLEPEALARSVGLGRGRGDGAGWGPAHEALARADTSVDQAERSLANRDFHHELYAGCGNPLLVSLLDDLRDQTALVSAAAWRGDRPGPSGSAPSWEHEAAEHRGVLAAARAGHAARAASLLKTHIASFVQRNFPAVPEQPQPAQSHQENHG